MFSLLVFGKLLCMRRQTYAFRGQLLSVGVVVAVLLIIVTVATWDRAFRHASPASPGMSCPAIVQPTGHPPLAAIGIHRVLLIGDSIMVQASCSLGVALAGEGVQTSRQAVSGSGLLTGWVDWQNKLPPLLRVDHPDAVVALFVGNYLGPPLRNPDGTSVADGSPEFFALWQKAAVRLSEMVQAAGATMYWVSPPPISAPVLDHAQHLFLGYSSIPGVKILNAGPVLAAPDGKEVLAIKTCGKQEIVRTLPDGIHLTDQGARIYGEEIAHLLTDQTGLLVSPEPC